MHKQQQLLTTQQLGNTTDEFVETKAAAATYSIDQKSTGAPHGCKQSRRAEILLQDHHSMWSGELAATGIPNSSMAKPGVHRAVVLPYEPLSGSHRVSTQGGVKDVSV